MIARIEPLATDSFDPEMLGMPAPVPERFFRFEEDERQVFAIACIKTFVRKVTRHLRHDPAHLLGELLVFIADIRPEPGSDCHDYHLRPPDCANTLATRMLFVYPDNPPFSYQET
jgi:hypothetical protein